jgi:hypothetical protein
MRARVGVGDEGRDRYALELSASAGASVRMSATTTSGATARTSSRVAPVARATAS